ncbi:MAG TPA: prenyltransferase/squalene oxidase repeat-containing protein [Candidatus Limnocylindrales bacterium]
MTDWRSALMGDPLPWLLDPEVPAARHLALRWLEDRAPDDPAVRDARQRAMAADPIAAILAHQAPDGYWEKPGPGYATKYRGTVWQVMFLHQLGADGSDPRVRAGCAYVLAHSQAPNGGFGASGEATASAPPNGYVIHCLNGNLLRALVGLGWLGDERLVRAIEWQARAVTGDGFGVPGATHWPGATRGPGFRCSANGDQPCAWGAVKAMLGLASIPPTQRSPLVTRAIEQAAEFLLGRDPATADYPTADRTDRPSGSWFKLGFPSGYVADVLQNLEALVDAGLAKDPRLGRAIEWLLSRQDSGGRWHNHYAYNTKTWTDFERQGAPSRFVTLRACRVLKAALS